MSQLRIRSAESLQKALSSPDLGVRIAVLKAIAADPARALAFAPHAGRDVIDVLLAQADETGTVRKAVVTALATFRDARVRSFFVRTYAHDTDPETVFLAAARLRAEPREVWEPVLRRGLMQDEFVARARAAARVLRDLPAPDVRERVRLGLLGAPVAAFDPETRAAWLVELSGPFAAEARHRLEDQGCGAFDGLVSSWSSLSCQSHAWLLRWAVHDWPDRARPCLRRALTSEHDEILRRALECVAASDELRESLQALVHGLEQSPSPTVRIAAIRALPRGVDWRRRVRNEHEPVVRAACVLRLGRDEGRAALGDLIACCADGDAAVRGAAVQALRDLGPHAAGPVRGLLRHPQLPVRAAACQVLLSLGKDDWLRDDLLQAPALKGNGIRPSTTRGLRSERRRGRAVR